MTTPKGNAVLVEALSSSLRRGGNALEDVPGLLKRILKEEAWRRFTTPRGELVEYSEFIDFVTTPPTAGLGATAPLVRKIISGDPEAVDLFDEAVQTQHGGDRRSAAVIKNDNVTLERPTGNTQTAALRRLRKDAPELHAEVLAGNLSAHAAMVQAGFRAKSVSVPVTRPEAVAATLLKHMEPDDIAEVVRLLIAS